MSVERRDEQHYAELTTVRPQTVPAVAASAAVVNAAPLTSSSHPAPPSSSSSATAAAASHDASKHRSFNATESIHQAVSVRFIIV